MVINNTIFNCTLNEVLDELEVQLKANGFDYFSKRKDTPDNIMVCCPYHQERNPSAGIRKEDGLFHCFACGETHSLDELITYCFGKKDVLGQFGFNWLRKNFGSISVEVRKDVEIDVARPNISNKGSVMDDSSNNQHNFVTEEELDKYRYYHPYWKKRGITNEHIIELFDLGYDKETNCITFPIRDKKGNCLFIARRSVSTKYFHYPAGAKKPLYGEYELQCEARIMDNTYINKKGKSETARGEIWMQTIIVCESMLDALTCWQYGKYAVALNGLGTSKQFQELRGLPCRKLILATDNDEAGQKARQRIRENVGNKIITEYILPDGKKDLNDLSLEEFKTLREVL